MTEKKFPLILNYEPIWCEDSRIKPCYYRLAPYNEESPYRIIQTPDYDTWEGEWVTFEDAMIEEVMEETLSEAEGKYRIQREDPPLGYFYVMFIETDYDKPLELGAIVYEAFLPVAPTLGHMLNVDGKFYDIVDCTWTIDKEQYGTTAECYLMVEVAMVGDATKLIERQVQNQKANERRAGFVVHNFEKPDEPA